MRVLKEHNSNCWLMHKKIDIMATNMGIQFFHPRWEQEEVGGTSMAKSIDMTAREPFGKMKHTKLSSPGVSSQGRL